MAVVSTNAWKVDIEETLQNAIRNEFKSSMPIFRDKENKIRGNQFAIFKGDNLLIIICLQKYLMLTI